MSYRTQEMYLVVFMTRYMDLFLYYISLYNTVFKILFIAATSYIIYLIRAKKPFCLGYDPKTDSLNHYLFIYPVVLLVTVVFHLSSRKEYLYYEYLWSFSVWLEAVAIIPQLYIVYRKREVSLPGRGHHRLVHGLSGLLQGLLRDELDLPAAAQPEPDLD